MIKKLRYGSSWFLVIAVRDCQREAVVLTQNVLITWVRSLIEPVSLKSVVMQSHVRKRNKLSATSKSMFASPPTISPHKMLRKCSYFSVEIAVQRKYLRKYIHFHRNRSSSAENEKINALLHQFKKSIDIRLKGCKNAGFWEKAMASNPISCVRCS